MMAGILAMISAMKIRLSVTTAPVQALPCAGTAVCVLRLSSFVMALLIARTALTNPTDTWSKCNFCKEEGSVPCPGFPENCAKMCDGKATCPDRWDELLSTCTTSLAQSNEAGPPICSSKEAALSPCDDGSMCLSSEQQCNAIKDCASGSDEDSESCNSKSQLWANQGHPLHRCDNGSCILLKMACSAHKEPLCKDGSDMADTL